MTFIKIGLFRIDLDRCLTRTWPEERRGGQVRTSPRHVS